MKLLIADDDRQVVEGISEGIDWKSLGISQVIPAFNGMEAFELFKINYPEIVITDIRMPGMDGLELLRKMKELMPEVKVVILSGYSDFEYMKKAIQFGTVDYELKPFKLRNFINLIKRVKDSIIKEKVSEERFTRYLEAHKEKFISQLLDGKISDRNIILDGLKQYFDFDGRGILVCVVLKIDYYTKWVRHKTKEEQEELTALIKEYICSIGLGFAGPLILVTGEAEFTVINKTIDSAMHINKLKTNLKNNINIMNSKLEKEFGLSVSAGISGRGTAPLISELSGQAKSSLKYKLYSGVKSVNYFSGSPEPEKSYFVTQVNEENIKRLIEKLDYDSILSMLSSEFDRLENERCCNKNGVINFSMLLLNILITVLKDFSKDFENFIDGKAGKLDDLSYFECIDDYRKFVLNLYNEALCEYSEINKMKLSTVMQKAIDYIKKNYNKDLTVELAAEYVGKTPNYFSHIFKKELGISFTEYVNEIRISKACDLILHSNLLIYEIGEQVGYRDYAYFTQIFKKFKGCSPTDFRKGNT